MTLGRLISRRKVDPRGVWMRQNLSCKPFDAGRWAGKPMNALRVSTMIDNSQAARCHQAAA